MKKLLFLYLSVCSLAFSQGVRYDPVPVLTTASNVPPGAMAPVLAISGASIHVCSFPANAVPCTNFATTYTDVTLNTACANTAQITLPGTTQCVSSTDQQGNFGFWVFPGEYSYTITIPTGQSYGPYPIMTLNNGSQLSYLQGATGSVSRTVTNRLQDYVSVKDFGATGNGTTDDAAAINAAISWACSVGAKVFMPQGHYLVNSTISFPNGCEGVEFSGPSDNEAVTPGARIIWGGAANGTVFSVYGTSWCRFHDFTVDGASTAGVGIFFYADTVSPFLRSSQKDLFSHIYVRNVTGTPGNCLQVGRLGSGDDVSQSTFDDFSFDHCVVGIYQAGGQTIENLYRHNTFGSSISKYGTEFDEGDVHMQDNMFIGGGPSSKIANVYVKSTALRADLERNYYEDNATTGLDPTVFSNYLFADGANPNRPFPTKIDSDRVQWALVGGKVLDYEQAAPITVNNQTGDDIFQPNSPGAYYINSGNGIQTVYAKFSAGFLSSPSQVISIGNNVVMTSDNPGNQMMANVFEGRDASITGGSTALTIGAANFTSSMVGYSCYVQKYLTGNIAQQNAITAFTDSTHVTLASAATNTASGLYYRCGRLVNAGQANATVSDTVSQASNVVEGQIPQYQLRRFLSGSAWQNWAWHTDSSGSHIGLMSTDSPTSASYSDFFTLNATTAGGKTASSVTFPVPLRIGGATHQLVGIYYQDFTGISVGTIAANSSFSTTVTLTGDTLTSGVDGCQAWGGISVGGIVSQCTIQAANAALITYSNVTASSIAVGTTTIRVEVHKFSYTGP